MFVKSKKTTYVALLEPSKRPYWNSITSRKFWIFSNTIFKNIVYRRRGCLIEVFRNLSTLLFCKNYCCWNLHLCNMGFFTICKTLELPPIEYKCELDVSFCFGCLNLYPKFRRNFVFRNVRELLPDYTVSSQKYCSLRKNIANGANLMNSTLTHSLHCMNRASWYTHVTKTNKMHTFLNNLFHLNYPRNVSKNEFFIIRRVCVLATYSIPTCILRGF